jgi:hypothetical protein
MGAEDRKTFTTLFERSLQAERLAAQFAHTRRVASTIVAPVQS